MLLRSAGLTNVIQTLDKSFQAFQQCILRTRKCDAKPSNLFGEEIAPVAYEYTVLTAGRKDVGFAVTLGPFELGAEIRTQVNPDEHTSVTDTR